jgi:hypothetical protein
MATPLSSTFSVIAIAVPPPRLIQLENESKRSKTQGLTRVRPSVTRRVERVVVLRLLSKQSEIKLQMCEYKLVFSGW